MVEQNAAAAEDAVALAVVHRHPVRIQLGHAIGAARVEGRVFHLRNGLHLAEHFRCAGLVEANFGVDDANGLQQVQRADAGDLRRGVGLVKGHTNEALRGEVVHLHGFTGLQQAHGRAHVGKVELHQMQLGVLGNAKFLEAPEVNRTGAAVGALDSVAFG